MDRSVLGLDGPVLHHLGGVVWTFDANGICTWVSDSVRPVLGWDPASLIGTPAAIAEPEDAGQQRQRVNTPQGAIKWVEVFRDDTSEGGWTVCMRDITDQVEVEQLLAASLQSTLEPHVFLRAVREDDEVRDFTLDQPNEQACAALGRDRAEVEGLFLSDLLATDSTGEMLSRFVAAFRGEQPVFLNDHPFPSETGRPFDIRAVKVADGLSLSWREVTERHLAAGAFAASDEQFRQLAESLGDVVRAFDLNGIHQWVSPSVEGLLGYKPEELIGTSAMDLMRPDDIAAAVREGTSAAVAGKTAARARRTRLRHADGHWVWTETTNSFRYGPTGAVVQVYAVSRDAEHQVRAEAELRRMAHSDPLTGLLNRSGVVGELASLMSVTTDADDGHIAVMFCDIDNLKTINDTLGHTVGDAVIVAAARRCSEMLDPTAIIGRYGGDELLVVLPQVDDLASASHIAARLQTADDARPPRGGPQGSISIGLTLVRTGDSVDAVVERADQAMYEAKSSGRNQVVAVP